MKFANAGVLAVKCNIAPQRGGCPGSKSYHKAKRCVLELTTQESDPKGILLRSVPPPPDRLGGFAMWLLSVTECQHPPSSHKHRTQQLMCKTVHFPQGEACYRQWAWKGHEIARWTHDQMPQLPWTIITHWAGERLCGHRRSERRLWENWWPLQ